MAVHQTARPDRRGDANATLWFSAPDTGERRAALNRERVVAEALALIAQEGVPALTMRAVAARLGVVPGALYRHVRSKEQLQDLLLDGVLAEVDCTIDRALPWADQIKVLAHRLRDVLADHPGVAGLMTVRDPLGPHSLTLAEAFLQPLHTAGFPHREAGLAFFLIVGYAVGFEVGNTRISVNEQRVQDPATRRRLHEFFRSLPDDRFPTLVALGEHVWLDNRDERFEAGLDVLVSGLQRRATAPSSDADAGLSA
ncbi:MAG TPA: TetR/AcrR family transcriptional regulator [Pseudonocardiaceae bacterium]